MGSWNKGSPTCGKGPVPYWLDRCSTHIHAIARLTALLDALEAIAPSYQGLEEVFDKYLAAHFCKDVAMRERLAAYLKAYWFNDGPDSYFPGQKVAQKYGQAVSKTIELSLNGRHHPVPINAWWIIQPAEKVVRMMNLTDVDRNGLTVGSSVTLLIMTPEPPRLEAPSKVSLWGDAEAWITEQRNAFVVTHQVEKEVK